MSQQQFFDASTRKYNRTDFEEIRTLKLAEDKLQQTHESWKSHTLPLSAALRQQPPVVWRKTVSSTEPSAENFVVLPHGITSRVAPRWLIRLIGLHGRSRSLGIEVASDIVLGIMRTLDSRPDLDLDLFSGVEKGVSRRHAMIRPSANHLYLIDLRSTNGTRINGVPIEPGHAVHIQSGDLISLGILHFNLVIAATPTEIEQAVRTRGMH